MSLFDDESRKPMGFWKTFFYSAFAKHGTIMTKTHKIYEGLFNDILVCLTVYGIASYFTHSNEFGNLIAASCIVYLINNLFMCIDGMPNQFSYAVDEYDFYTVTFETFSKHLSEENFKNDKKELKIRLKGFWSKNDEMEIYNYLVYSKEFANSVINIERKLGIITIDILKDCGNVQKILHQI